MNCEALVVGQDWTLNRGKALYLNNGDVKIAPKNCWRSLFQTSRTWKSVTNDLLEWMEIMSESIRNTETFSYHLMYRCRRHQTRNADFGDGKEWVFCGAKYFIPDWDTALISCVMIIRRFLKNILSNDSLVSTQKAKSMADEVITTIPYRCFFKGTCYDCRIVRLLYAPKIMIVSIVI